jgi:hypothetical protein
MRILYWQSQLPRIDLRALGSLVDTPVEPCEQQFAYPERTTRRASIVKASPCADYALAARA